MRAGFASGSRFCCRKHEQRRRDLIGQPLRRTLLQEVVDRSVVVTADDQQVDRLAVPGELVEGIAEARLRLQVAQGGDSLPLRLDVFFDLALDVPGIA